MRTPFPARVAALITLGLSLAAAGGAQDLPPPDPRAVVSIITENDAYGLDQSDRWYTNGLRLGWLSPEGSLPAPIAALDRRMAVLFGAAQSRWGLALTQRVFTPVNKRLRNPDPEDRPYAGTLMAEMALQRRTANTLDRFALQIGMVGPASLAEASQSFVHHALSIRTPLGWSYQVPNQPLLNLYWDRAWRVPLSPGTGIGVDLVPSIGLSVGLEQIYAGGGARLRFGTNLAEDFSPPRIRPALGTPPAAPAREFGWYLFLGAGGRVVGYDVTLNGTPWRDSRSVTPLRFVGELEAGAALTWNGLRLGYTHVWRSREFIDQSRGFQFGSISLTAAF